jgi:hypothetical protein
MTIGPGPVAAQSEVKSDPSGLQLGVHLNASAVKYEGEDFSVDEVEKGGGLGFTLGYGFNRTVSLFANFDGATLNAGDERDEFILGHGDLGLRLAFGREDRAAMMYLVGAVTGRMERYDVGGEDVDVYGPGLTGGVGFFWFLSPTVAIDLGLLGTWGEYTTVSSGGESVDLDPTVEALSSRIDIGLTWVPGGG